MAVSSLESGLTKPHLLCGGGCTETSIAHYITQKVSDVNYSVTLTYSTSGQVMLSLRNWCVTKVSH